MLPGSGPPGRQLGSPLESQLSGLLAAFGDHHAGHFGRAEGSFQVDADHESRFRITATLPGYKLGDGGAVLMGAAESPLSVRAVGHRSLVVSGMQQSGPIIRSWQRTFSLPKGSDIDNVAATYASGVLTVDVPRRNVTGEDNAEDADDDDALLPPALRAMRSGLPGLLGQLNAPPRSGG
nr:small heat shock protein sHsp18.4 [Dinophyceae sp.]